MCKLQIGLSKQEKLVKWRRFEKARMRSFELVDHFLPAQFLSRLFSSVLLHLERRPYDESSSQSNHPQKDQEQSHSCYRRQEPLQFSRGIHSQVSRRQCRDRWQCYGTHYH